MTLSMNDVRNRVAQKYPDVEQVEDSVIRFTRKSHGRPFAVYYLDIAASLPNTRQALTDYQDRVIGKHYFDGSKSLQWSNYLYFLVSPEQLQNDDTLKAKELIEGDRTYARKCVITSAELEAAIQPLPLPTIDGTPTTSILSVWLTKLAGAGLLEAILCDDNLPTRLSLIETSTPAIPSVSQRVPQSQAAKALPFIRSLSLTQFRDFPAQRKFNLGTVNLIFGVNGSGKTSLFEAIELFYCGRTERNPRADVPYRLDVVFADGTTETATSNRALQTFRDRNLAWYGQSEVMTNNLCVSFGQFNFLDTDAAVELSESSSRLEENLSKLLIGSQASKTWHDMERVCEALSSKIRELEPLQAQIKSELTVIEDQLKRTGNTIRESDSIRERMKDMVRRSGWSVPADEKEQFASRLVESLSELISLAQQATALEWAPSPVSVNSLLRYCKDAADMSDRADKDIARLKELRNDESQAADAIKRCDDSETFATVAERLVTLGVPALNEELTKLFTAIQGLRDDLAGYDASAQVKAGANDGTAALEKYVALILVRRRANEAKLANAKMEHARFAALRDEAMNLAQQLREFASEILKVSDKPDECPLCHSQFPPGQLIEHMQLGVDSTLESRAQELLSQLRKCEEELRTDEAQENAALWLAEFCKHRGYSTNLTLQEALTQVNAALVSLADAERRAETVRQELRAIESQGLTTEMLTEIPAALFEIGQSLKAWTKDDVAILRESIEKERRSSRAALESIRKETDELQRATNAMLHLPKSDLASLQSTVFQLKERAVLTDSLLSRLNSILQSLPWDADKPLSELIIVAESIRKVAGEFQTALATERQANTAIAEATKRKEQLTTQLNRTAPRLARFSEAQRALQDILDQHSLTDAMNDALKRNRVGIETIFARIHCPAEFSCLGTDLTTLVRKNKDLEATLSQISTGQRAAFALSIFLAQNAQLTSAPPVLLIDDPIAHVDDLNSLSFLDYLRDLALTGGRQILFSTASEKLASLFERKFDFLGPEHFCRHNLHRHA